MCGIIGCVGRDDTLGTLVHGLSKLEYRGYDSAGVALGGETLGVLKRAGELGALRDALEGGPDLSGSVGIGHTRWSTHGPPTDENAHPHLDCAGSVAVVHNGIIENYQKLRDELSDAGHEFESDTDTEVVPHLIEAGLESGADPETAFRAAIDRLEGSFAIACLVAGRESVFVARNDSPLVLGIDGDATYLASDVPAFREFTDRVVYLDDGEFAELSAGGWQVTDADGAPVEKSIETVAWDPEDTGKSGYDHFMLKEIHEQPRALRQCLRGRVDELGGTVSVEELGDLDFDRIHLVAAGTSYHAAVYGAGLLSAEGISAQAHYAHEYASSPPPIEDATVVGVSQSGETADTLAATREARRRGAGTLALTNTVGSTMARECDDAFYIRSGPEIGVAATKTFAGQQTALNLLTQVVADGTPDRDLVSALRDLPGDVQTILDESNAEAVAEAYLDAEAYFFIGRGLNFPVALEGALKMKEISYEHAEGFAAGELKHGPLALVTANTPVFATVVGDGELARKTVGNVKEVEARDAPVVAVTDGRSDADRYADHTLEIPETDPRTAAILANVQLQLASYHTAAKLGRSIDKPRNLAKSVTVE
ncbi:glutamine--fructose-6-phosphate transaminase (isomerizing) [Natronomonas sp. F2-12]|jgi:glucosamine--fructose-6-phosphate aminotransferase (isomerizing)|uniref:Glutamine--fructose-6-phosphate aminotransferase [isomerizing] n=1 Tax=Natronomonas aquatica TaxID=2841590 RepID=A0A9R1D5M9_9EURY|nr:glutamine--fructose-6-phosphate transaminase (isomerizing) [Natronomonas aquatica]MCQ4334499.1 glutamine--fructose-6-phosphate transaminase (isomerizing) [Natronomonas aquatica]